MVELYVLFSNTSNHSVNLKATKKITFKESFNLISKIIKMNRDKIKLKLLVIHLPKVKIKEVVC